MPFPQAPGSATLDQPRPTDRFPCEVPTTCQPPSAWAKDPWPATIRDISTGGIHLSLARRFERGSGLAIELPAEDGSTSTVLARVTRVDKLEADGGWLLECAFISELSDEEVQQVLNLDPMHSASLSDGKVADAPTATVSGVLFQAKLGRHEMLRWYVRRLDLSAQWPLPAGRSVSLRVCGVPESAAPVELRVSKCQVFGAHWVVDCEMVSRPSPEVLRALTSPGAA